MKLNLQSIDEARQDARAAACPGCKKQGTLTALEVLKDGPNQGRLFMKCGHCGHFTWLSQATAAAEPPPPRVRSVTGEQRPTPGEGQEEAGLIEDISDNPADDGLRLIYADWLDEHGQPERAEFVRVQVRLARLAADDPARGPLEQREGELLDEHRAAWLGPIAALVTAHEFVLGLLDNVAVTAATFCVHAEVLLRTAPAATWRIAAPGWADVREVVRCGQLPRVRRLALVDGRIGGAGARILAESSTIANLRELTVSGQSLGQPGVQALAGSAYLRGLQALDLSSNNLSRSSIPILVSSTNLPGLRKLNLGRNLLGNSDARALASAKHWPHLRELDLSGNAIDNEGAEALASSGLLRQLVRLDLYETGVSAIGARKLAQSPHARPELRVGQGRKD
jgi:uncharacterized protein (TIGR02996 family)